MAPPPPPLWAAHLDDSDFKGVFGERYVAGVALAAGIGLALGHHELDRDGIDLTLTGKGNWGPLPNRGPKLDVQVKCTGSPNIRNGFLYFDLPVENYDALRDPNVSTPRILVVVCVPKDAERCLTVSADQLIMRHRAFWRTLLGEPATPNTDKIRVPLSTSQLFDPAAVVALMEAPRR